MKNSRKQRFCLFFFIHCLCLSTGIADPLVLNLSDFTASLPLKSDPLWSYHDQLVHIRGFWYPLSLHQGLLASAPDLKSCCMRSPQMIHHQLIVKGEHITSFSAQQAITLKGIFKIDPLYNQEGQFIQLYVLEQAKYVPQTSNRLLPFALILFLASLIGWTYVRGVRI